MTEVPGYVAGTWTIDPSLGGRLQRPSHGGEQGQGRLRRFQGTFVTAEDPLASSVAVTVDASSINTNYEQRDGHIKSADFFETCLGERGA
jgi:polyisoprenoid-binding protein YceI